MGKKKRKQARELTNDEVMRRIFPKEVRKELKKIAAKLEH